MGKDRPPSYQWYPSDFAASMHKYGFTDSDELAYRRALDASFEEQAFGVGSPDDWCRWARVNGGSERFLAKLRLVTMECPDGTLAQVRMARQRMEQQMLYLASVKGGLRSAASRLKGPSSGLEGPSSGLEGPSTLSSSSSSSLEPKDKTSGVTAACLARVRKRFPSLDIPLIEGKLMAYHQHHPYRNLDMAMLNWCKSAENRGTDQSQAEVSMEEWKP